jgi:hypothetical protein
VLANRREQEAVPDRWNGFDDSALNQASFHDRPCTHLRTEMSEAMDLRKQRCHPVTTLGIDLNDETAVQPLSIAIERQVLKDRLGMFQGLQQARQHPSVVFHPQLDFVVHGSLSKAKSHPPPEAKGGFCEFSFELF